MKRHIAALFLCGGAGVLASACATKGFVREQVGATETKLNQRVETQETKLSQTADRTAANSQAIDAAGQQLQGLDTRVGEVDTRVGEVSALARDAKQEAATVSEGLRTTETRLSEGLRETEDRFSQRFANRNKYAMLEAKAIYFDFAKADLRDEGINELEEVAKALKADPNVVVELQGFADPRGSERYNYQLTRERVDAVIRYLVQRHGIDLRRIHAVGMGKVTPAAGEKASGEAFGKSRRVDIRLFAPQG